MILYDSGFSLGAFHIEVTRSETGNYCISLFGLRVP